MQQLRASMSASSFTPTQGESGDRNSLIDRIKQSLEWKKNEVSDVPSIIVPEGTEDNDQKVVPTNPPPNPAPTSSMLPKAIIKLFAVQPSTTSARQSVSFSTAATGDGVPLQFVPRQSKLNNTKTSHGSGTRDVSCLLSHGLTGKSLDADHDKAKAWEEQDSAGEGHGHDDEGTDIPIPLLVFSILLAILAGLCVAVFHKLIVYGGCPLGINGCDESSKKKKKAAFLVKLLTDDYESAIPEDVVYMASAVLGSMLISLIMSLLDINTAFQLRGGGTMQSLIAVAMGRPIAWRCAIMRVLVTTIFLSTGGTLGADGPAIQICTSVVGSLGWVLGMQAPGVQSILASLGFACGFAASFNSPVAGILFAMEELGHVTRSVTREVILLIILASITSTAVARSTHGEFQLFYPGWEEEVLTSSDGGSIHKVFGQSMWMVVAIPIGILCSLVGWFVSRGIRAVTLICKSIGVKRWILSALIALLASSMGSLAFRATGLRGVWGIGAESMQKGFDDDIHAWEYAVFALCKALAMILQVGARFSGDILEPVLIAGGFFGGACGHLLELILDSDPELSAIVGKPCLVFGMVGLFSSCFRFPLTPVVITLELMGPDTYALVLPTVLCSFTAVLVSNRLFHPLFHDMLGMDGINLQALSRQAVLEESQEEVEILEDILDPGNHRSSYEACDEGHFDCQEGGRASSNIDSSNCPSRSSHRAFFSVSDRGGSLESLPNEKGLRMGQSKTDVTAAVRNKTSRFVLGGIADSLGALGKSNAQSHAISVVGDELVRATKRQIVLEKLGHVPNPGSRHGSMRSPRSSNLTVVANSESFAGGVNHSESVTMTNPPQRRSSAPEKDSSQQRHNDNLLM